MTKKLCFEEGCETPAFSRKLCNKHYMAHRYRGTLDTISPATHHSLTNINPDGRTADCSQCGEGFKITKHGAQWKCRTKARQNGRKQLTFGTDSAIPRADIHTAFTELNRVQNGLCAICKKPCDTNDVLSVDHCHETGKIRGLLCNKCNIGIGMLGDSVAGVQAALDYLKEQ